MTNWSSDSKNSSNWKPRKVIETGESIGLLLSLTYTNLVSLRESTNWTKGSTGSTGWG